MKQYDYTLKDTPFNSSFAYLERMERRWEDADQAKIGGDTMTYFRVLETIYRNAHPFFTGEMEVETPIIKDKVVNGYRTEKKTEVVVCEEMTTKIEKLLETQHSQRDLRAAGVWVGENQCDKFRMILVKLLFKYKITYAKKEKIDLVEEVEDDY